MTDPICPAHDPEAATAQPAVIYSFRLYISGATPRSARAICNIKKIGAQYLGGKYDLQVIDVYQCKYISRGQPWDIVALPTLLKDFPLPVRRITGDLSNTRQVLRRL